MAKVTWRRNIAENFNRLSRAHERYRRQTTDGRTMTYSEQFTFAKNQKCIVTYSLQAVALVVLGVGGLWLNFLCVCTETAIYELPIKILTQPLDSAILISYIAIGGHLPAFLATCSRHMHINSYFRASGQNSNMPLDSVTPIF